MTDYPPHIISDVKNRYTILKQSARVIAENVSGLSQDDVYEILRQLEIPRNNPGGSPATDPNIVSKIIHDYVVEKLGANTVAARYEVSKKTVYNHVIKSGNKLRPRSDRKGNATSVPAGVLSGVTPTGRKRGSGRTGQLALNDNVFSELTPDTAYWIGYVLCDGCIIRPKGRTSLRFFLRQGMRHFNHLEKFKAFIGAKNVITTGTHLDPAGVEQEHCCLQVTSSALCVDLARYGMVGLKPTRMAADDRLLRHPHFWRGCVDADGSIYPDLCKIYLSGHVPLLDQWQALCLIVAGGLPPHRHEQPGCFVDTLTGERARKMTDWLYRKNAGEGIAEKRLLALKMQRPEE